MALGIYTSLYVLNKLKDKIPPVVDFVDFEDGLLTVRSRRELTSKNTIIRLKASFGTLMAAVKLESYDEKGQVYRLTMLEHELVLSKLEDDRRMGVRLPRVLKVESQALPERYGFTEDISATGVRLASSEVLSVGQIIDLKMELGDLKLEIEAEVCWSARKLDESYHSGLRFHGLTKAQAHNIECFVSDHLKLEQKLKELEE